MFVVHGSYPRALKFCGELAFNSPEQGPWRHLNSTRAQALPRVARSKLAMGA